MNFLNSEGLSRVQTHIQTALDMKADKLLVEKQFTDSVADWNQNDEFAPDYVKNRPFYTTDPVETVIFEEQTVTINEANEQIELTDNVSLTIGETYIVNFNGVKYECVAYQLWGAPVIGNGLLAEGNGGNNEPFLIVGNYNILQCSTVGTYTLSISAVQTEIHRIDPKYIKDMYCETPIEITVLNGVELNVGDTGAAELPSETYLLPEKTYIVTINGLEYTCVATDYSDSDNDRVVIGNASLCETVPSGLDTGEPFGICRYSTDVNGVEFAAREPGIYTVSIKLLYNQITKVPEKYLPEIDSAVNKNSSNAVSSSAVAQAIKNSVHLEKSYFTIGNNSSHSFEIQYFNEPKVYVAQNISDNVHYYSEDALNWILISIPSETSGRITYGKGKFVYCTSTHVYYSEDLITWNSSSLPTERNWYDIVYGNDMFLTMSKEGEKIYYTACSTDGITWTETEVVLPSYFYELGSIKGFVYVGNKFILINTGTNVITYSVDGITWKQNHFNNNYAFRSTIYGGGDGKILITGSYSDSIVWAENGESLYEYGWHNVKLPKSLGNCDQIIYVNNTFFITDNSNGKITYSTDCENWITFDPSDGSIYGQRPIYSICHDGEKFVASTRIHNGDSYVYNCVMFSDDGLNWIYNKPELFSNGKNETIDVKRALNIAQADWNQNDETAPDYIKNKPFGKNNQTTVISEQEVDLTNISGETSLQLTPINTFNVGDLVIVKWGNNTYECIAGADMYSGLPWIGNPRVGGYTSLGDTGEPFYMGFSKYNNYLNIWSENQDVRTIEVISYTITKIDQKYLPDTVATKTEVDAAIAAAIQEAFANIPRAENTAF